MRPVFMVAAKRTLVSPRHGRWRTTKIEDLMTPVLEALVEPLGQSSWPQEIILGNALYGGGNPARLAALAAGFPHYVFASTLDTQCCSGLDAIILGASKIAAGNAEVIIAGGVESYSRSPIRQHRAVEIGQPHIEYQRPPFTPWPDRDPDLLQAAAQLAAQHGVTREAQEKFACESHAKAIAADFRGELVAADEAARDDFTRDLTLSTCRRLPVLTGDGASGITSATVAVEADAAAGVLLMSSAACARLGVSLAARLIDFRQLGGDPERPVLAGIEPAKALLASLRGRVAVAELMESFAVQAMQWQNALGLEDRILNRGGGSLARGHPIGASGAILLVRLFHELMKEEAGASGLAAIAAAGGLGSAILLQKC